MNNLKAARSLSLFALVMTAAVTNWLATDRATASDLTHGGPSTPIALADLRLEHDGKEVDVIFKVSRTQAVGGTRFGRFPHLLLHHSKLSARSNVNVWVQGQLADTFRRFDLAPASPNLPSRSVDLTIRASGKLDIHHGPPRPDGKAPVPIFNLTLKDVDKFQITRDGS